METRQLVVRLTWTQEHGWDVGATEIRIINDEEERQHFGECFGNREPTGIVDRLLDEFTARVRLYQERLGT